MNKLLIILLLPVLFIITSCDSNEAIYCPSGSYGCDGICGSDIVIDDCGICGGLNASMDCSEVCEGDDLSCADGCGILNGLNPFIPYDDCNFICDYTIDETCGYWLSQGYSCTELIKLGHDCSSCQSEGFCANPDFFGMEGLCGVTGDDVDCAGVCFGTSLIDDCGDCSLLGNFNSSQDDCGVCYGGNADQDCAGVCLGDAWESDCGCVSGPNFGDDCNDCADTPNGDAVIDDCGICSGGNSGNIENADQDCQGVCFGVAVLDECGVCDGSGLNEDGCCGDETTDCAGVCDGTAIDDCAGECGGSVVEDCAGECGGSAVEDCAGVCDGDGICPLIIGNWIGITEDYDFQNTGCEPYYDFTGQDASGRSFTFGNNCIYSSIYDYTDEYAEDEGTFTCNSNEITICSETTECITVTYTFTDDNFNILNAAWTQTEDGCTYSVSLDLERLD